MTDINTFIQSGILEMYVLGATTPAESELVSVMAAMHSDVRDEIDAISEALETYGQANAIEPHPSVRPFVMAMIEYTERLKNGETPTFPPALHAGSRPGDYAPWLDRTDLQLTEPLEDAYAHIVGQTTESTTAIVWLKYGAPPETHTTEHERIMVLEGTCDVTIGEHVHSLKRGDVLVIPLHINHFVQVTSECACKIILQREAA